MLFLQDSQSSIAKCSKQQQMDKQVYTIYTNLTFYKDHADLHLYRQHYFIYSLFINL